MYLLIEVYNDNRVVRIRHENPDMRVVRAPFKTIAFHRDKDCKGIVCKDHLSLKYLAIDLRDIIVTLNFNHHPTTGGQIIHISDVEFEEFNTEEEAIMYALIMTGA